MKRLVVFTLLSLLFQIDLLAQYNIKVGSYEYLSLEAPASKAGLKKGDIIVKLNDADVGSLAEFRYELYKYDVGDKVKITFYRDGKMQNVNVTLGKNANS